MLLSPTVEACRLSGNMTLIVDDDGGLLLKTRTYLEPLLSDPSRNRSLVKPRAGLVIVHSRRTVNQRTANPGGACFRWPHGTSRNLLCLMRTVVSGCRYCAIKGQKYVRVQSTHMARYDPHSPSPEQNRLYLPLKQNSTNYRCPRVSFAGR